MFSEAKEGVKLEEKEIIFIGWKAICEACGILSVDTMKGIAIKYKLPIKDINGKPAIVRTDLIESIKKLPLRKTTR